MSGRGGRRTEADVVLTKDGPGVGALGEHDVVGEDDDAREPLQREEDEHHGARHTVRRVEVEVARLAAPVRVVDLNKAEQAEQQRDRVE